MRLEVEDPTSVEAAVAHLVVTEATTRNTGSDARTRNAHEVHRSTVPLSATSDGGFSGLVAIPTDAALPPTMDHPAARVTWTVEVRASVPRSLDVTESVVVEVRST